MIRGLTFILITIVLSIFVIGCQSTSVINGEKTIEKIELLKIKNMADKKPGIIKTFTHPEQIEVIQKALESATRIEGVLDVASAEYSLKLYYPNSQTKTFFLWISKEAGMIMDIQNTHTGYKLTKKSSQVLYGLIND